jgi:murein DD-endopeptidase MepM/ murein hydrolase activator NlpD
MITKTLLIVTAFLLILLPTTFLVVQQFDLLPDSQKTLPQQIPQDEESGIEKAIRDAINQQKEASLALLMYDTQIDDIQISEDGNWATAWIIPVDPETGQVVPAEPGLVLVQRDNDEWKAVLPSEARWVLVVKEVPDDLIPPEEKIIYGQLADLRASAVSQGPYGGYYLPWKGGETMALTQSVGHDRYTPSGSAHYAFDFAKPGYPSGMFDVHAAKSGTVKQAVWRHPNGDPNNGNYLVLEDTTTNPTTYQLYLHLAQDSIPEAYRTIGTFVAQGDFLGVADDTGISSGNHLHFHVHTYAYSYWGTSVDITFEDVSINGGRPRIQTDLPYCKSSDICDSTQTTYVSQNSLVPDHTPPVGGIDNPPQGTTISSNDLILAGWASDENSGIASAQFIAKYNGAWHDVGESFSTDTFVTSWDMCADQVPDGPVSLALEIQDKASNQADGLPGLTHFTKNFSCPSAPSPCQPNINQVAIFSTKDYQGNCVVLDKGSYSTSASLGDLGDDQAASILVGTNVQATLFTGTSYTGRGETFINNDSNLKDNRIGKNTTSSVVIKDRGGQPETPTLIWPEDSASFSANSSFSLSWNDAGGAKLYKARILQDSSEVLATAWQTEPFWHLNALSAGSYSWQVQAKNGTQESIWSNLRTFNIETSSQSPSITVTAPFSDTMEGGDNGWTHNSSWARVNDQNHTPNGATSWHYTENGNPGYDTGKPNSGFLTSPEIQIPAGSEYFLRFWYQYETEGSGLQWDQRWVQISSNGGAFTNILHLKDDANNYWLQSPAISLASYAGQTIRVRFYFATLDSMFNNFKGWYIDDFSVTDTPPPDCPDSNNSYLEATPISDGSTTNAVICPGGDLDFYKFQGFAGDRIAAWTEAQVDGSPLDTFLFLLDIDGNSLLIKNDDLILSERTDSSVAYDLSRTGTYFLKIRSWDHTTSGGPEYTYKLNYAKDNQDPTANFLNPKNGGSIQLPDIELMVSAQDTTSGIRNVRFLWHTNEWQDSDWVLLGEDWDGTDGWNYNFDGTGITNLSGGAFYAIAYDWAGNSIGTGAWNLSPASIYLPMIKR